MIEFTGQPSWKWISSTGTRLLPLVRCHEILQTFTKSLTPLERIIVLWFPSTHELSLLMMVMMTNVYVHENVVSMSSSWWWSNHVRVNKFMCAQRKWVCVHVCSSRACMWMWACVCSCSCQVVMDDERSKSPAMPWSFSPCSICNIGLFPQIRYDASTDNRRAKSLKCFFSRCLRFALNRSGLAYHRSAQKMVLNIMLMRVLRMLIMRWIGCAKLLSMYHAQCRCVIRSQHVESSRLDDSFHISMLVGKHPGTSIRMNRLRHWRATFPYHDDNYDTMPWCPLSTIERWISATPTSYRSNVQQWQQLYKWMPFVKNSRQMTAM